MARGDRQQVHKDDETGGLLEGLLGDYSDKRAIAWLERKFASFDTSKAKSLSVDGTKNERENFRSARVLGHVRTMPMGKKNEANRPVLVASIAMKRDITERSSRQVQFNFAKKVLQEAVRGDAAGLEGYPSQGLFIFHDSDRYFRLSFVSGEMDGKKFKFNSAKRQSFFINPERPNNVARSRLNQRIATFEELKDAFSVEALTKEFYTRLFEWYEWALKPQTGVAFPNEVDGNFRKKSGSDDKKYNSVAVIRLITRLMFTWFVRQRGIVPNELFTAESAARMIKGFRPASMEDDNYYRCVLQNLFFATFNSRPDKRKFVRRPYRGKSDGFLVKTQYRYENEFGDAKAFVALMRDVPFLNCALFDCLDREVREEDGGGYQLFDGFSAKRERQAHVPNGLFFDAERGIIPLFGRYEFTIDENNADDADIALDPELLGKVFENLLGAFNPETRETARNATGSFYTPREIVDYMVAEALKRHLKTRVPELKDEWVENLFDWNKGAACEALPFDEDVAAKVRDALYACKILDPACGSGAFPMGILHAMVRLLHRLDPNNTDLNDRIIRRYRDEKSLPPDPMESEKEREERLAVIEQQLKDGQHYPDYTRKLYLIENCIYGVDIQPIAVQISKLRFFISLLCDQLKDNWNVNAQNAGLLSLPNLEAKFVCANTLVALPKTEGELALATAGIVTLRQKLQANRHKIFRARTYAQKESLKDRDRELRDQIREAVRGSLAKPDKTLIKVQRELIASYREERKPYETPKMVRRRKAVQGDLFGSPVQGELGYEDVDLNKARRDAIDAKIDHAKRKIAAEEAKAQPANVTAIDRLANLVAGWDPYDQNASSSFFDTKWMFNIEDGFDIVIGNPPYVSHDQIAINIPCREYSCFEAFADLYCYFYEKGVTLLSTNGVLSFITSNSYLRANYGGRLREYLLKHTTVSKLIDIEGTQIFESAVVNAVVAEFVNGQNDILAQIVHAGWNAGSFNDFVENSSYSYLQDDLKIQPWTLIRPELLAIRRKMEAAGPTLEQLGAKIRLGLATGDNHAFVIDSAKRAELIRQDKNSAKLIKPVIGGRDIQRYCHATVHYLILTRNDVDVVHDYPAVYEHLKSFGSEFRTRGARGRHWTNLRACAFWDDFKSEKLIWIDLTDRGRFSYSDSEEYLLNSAYFMLPVSGIQAKALLAILNSSSIMFYMRQIAATSGMGTLRWINNYVKLFPIPYMSDTCQQALVSIVDAILEVKERDHEADTSSLESQIDQLVYKLYGLTEEEIAIVEGRNKPAPEPQAKKPRRTKRSVEAETPQDEDDDVLE